MQQPFTAALKKDDSWMMPQLHFHDYLEVLVCMSSSGDFFVDGRRYPLTRGTIFLLSHAELHRSIAVQGSYIRYVLHIDPHHIQEVLGSGSNLLRCFGQGHRYALLDEAQLLSCAALLDVICRPQQRFGDDIRAKIAFAQLMLNLCELFEGELPPQPTPPKSFTKMQPVIDYIRQNLTEDLRLDSLAAKFYINKHYLCHLFKEATGFSIGEYITHNRLLKAKALLRQGETVQRSGELAGFGNNAHFIRTFHQMTGMTPGAYQRSGDF